MLCKDAKRKMTYDWRVTRCHNHEKKSISTCINLYQQSMQETMETTSHWITAMVNSEISVGTLRCQLSWLEHLAVRLKIPTKNPPFLGELDPGSWKPHLRFPALARQCRVFKKFDPGIVPSRWAKWVCHVFLQLLGVAAFIFCRWWNVSFCCTKSYCSKFQDWGPNSKMHQNARSVKKLLIQQLRA